MNWIDYLILFIVGSSVAVALMRGFLREVVGLMGWVVAFVVSTRFAALLRPHVQPYFETAGMAEAVAFFALFILTLIGMGLVGQGLRLLASQAGLSGIDRLLGLLFGFLRGGAIVTLGFVILLFLNVKTPTLVKESVLSPYFMQAAREATRLLPDDSSLLSQVKGSLRNHAADLQVKPKVKGTGKATKAGDAGASQAPADGPGAADKKKIDDLMRQLDRE